MNQKHNFFGIPVFPRKKQEIFSNVTGYLSKKPDGFFHITSLNPEIIVLAGKDQEFKTVLTDSSLKIIDGVGVLVAMRILNINGGERYAGVDLMKDLMVEAGRKRLRTVLIGGKPNLAKNIADCYNRKFGEKIFYGIEVPQNISDMNQSENKVILSEISSLKPRILFVAFGSPAQEKWIYRNRASLKGVLCMGVGGGFDFIGGEVKRAPYLLRSSGMEWLFRLLVQPWRLKRQLRLIKFVTMVIRELMTTYDRN